MRDRERTGMTEEYLHCGLPTPARQGNVSADGYGGDAA